MALGTDKRTDLHALNNFPFSIDKVFLKKTQYVSEPCTFRGEVVHADVNAYAVERSHNVS